MDTKERAAIIEYAQGDAARVQRKLYNLSTNYSRVDLADTIAHTRLMLRRLECLAREETTSGQTDEA